MDKLSRGPVVGDELSGDELTKCRVVSFEPKVLVLIILMRDSGEKVFAVRMCQRID